METMKEAWAAASTAAQGSSAYAAMFGETSLSSLLLEWAPLAAATLLPVLCVALALWSLCMSRLGIVEDELPTTKSSRPVGYRAVRGVLRRLGHAAKATVLFAKGKTPKRVREQLILKKACTVQSGSNCESAAASYPPACRAHSLSCPACGCVDR